MQARLTCSQFLQITPFTINGITHPFLYQFIIIIIIPYLDFSRRELQKKLKCEKQWNNV